MSTPARRSPRGRLARRLLVATAVSLAAGGAGAGGFLPTVPIVPLPDARVLTSAGNWLYGEVQVRSTDSRGITRITLREADGTRHKMDADDVERIVAPLAGALRRAAREEATSTLERVFRSDDEALETAAEVTFDAVAWPEPSRRVILQLVNPGFDGAIRVYGVENWKKGTISAGGIAISGDEPSAFVVVKDGRAPIKVGKRNYDELFPELFGDCPGFLERVPEKERELRRFADQLRAYDRECPATTR